MANHPQRKAATRRKVALNPTPDHDHDRDYAALRQAVVASFGAAVKVGDPLFTTNVDPDAMYASYLGNIDPSEAQVHNCTACRHFIKRYGHLVTIDDDGRLTPVMWNAPVPECYAASVSRLFKKVAFADVTGVFLSPLSVLGTPVTGEWEHFAVANRSRYNGRALDANQAAAAVAHRFETVKTALGEFDKKTLDEAIRVLDADAVNRAEKFMGPAKWLRDLHDRPRGRNGDNLLWRAVASAPEGYCHPRSGMIGTLLEDIKAGLKFEDIRRRFNAKMHPLQYQRPQAAPKSGAIEAAEKLVAKLGLERSLERRQATMDDMDEYLWSSEPPKKSRAKGGVFGHLASKSDAPARSLKLPPQTMTWMKFCNEVLPKAEEIEFEAPSHGQYIALTAAVHDTAPLLFKWDNDVAWYCYHGGSPASQFNVSPGWVKVEAIVPLPTMWGDKPMPFISEGDVIILNGCRDSRLSTLALFPECIRDDLHGVRSVLEAHSKSGQLLRSLNPVAGYDFRKGSTSGKLRVKIGRAVNEYFIDRWD